MLFELAAGLADRPFQDKHPGLAVASFVTHAIFLGTVIVASMYAITTKVPQVPAIFAFVAEPPVPIAPPPPPPSAFRGKKPVAPQEPRVPSKSTFVAPIESPAGIQPGIEPQDDEEGVIGGVEGGIPGGEVGGVVGAMVSVPLPPPAPAPPKPVRVGGNIQAPKLIHRVEPFYSPVAVGAKVSGTVILEATVNEHGDVVDVVVLRSIPLLDHFAVEAIKQWRYEPLLFNGVPTPFTLTVTLTFSIR